MISSTENAWRNSSDYACRVNPNLVTKPIAKVMFMAWDISRISKNLAGQFVYNENKRSISLADLVFTNIYSDTQRVYTSGSVDYIINYTLSNSNISTKDYKEQVTNLKYQLGSKLGAFTDQTKMKLVLDSRTPFNKGNVFLPKENYPNIFKYKFPVDVINYSGVIVEKQSYGFVVRGYDKADPVSKYKKQYHAQMMLQQMLAEFQMHL